MQTHDQIHQFLCEFFGGEKVALTCLTPFLSQLAVVTDDDQLDDDGCVFKLVAHNLLVGYECLFGPLFGIIAGFPEVEFRILVGVVLDFPNCIVHSEQLRELFFKRTEARFVFVHFFYTSFLR